jgi:putative membrane protein
MRLALICGGLLALSVAWMGPLPGLARRAFSAHMTMHMLVVAVAAPLLAIGMAGTSLDPVRRMPAVFAPLPASFLELAVVWAWHTPALHHAARHTASGLITEQALFLFSGVLVWISVFGGDPASRASRNAAGVVALLLTFMHMTLLGALLGLAPRLLYSHHQEFFGLTSLEHQHLGGAIMILAGGVSYLAGGLWLTAGLLNRTKAQERQRA